MFWNPNWIAIPLLYRAGLRQFTRHPWQLLLTVLGIALGVAVVVAIDLAQSSAQLAFRLSSEAVTGKATHQISGGAGGFDEQIYAKLRLNKGFRDIAPIVEGSLSSATQAAERLRLLGVDPVAEAQFRDYSPQPGRGSTTDWASLLTEPNTVVLNAATAQRLGIKAGDAVPVRLGGRTRDLRLLHILDQQDTGAVDGLDNVLITDIASAQELLGMCGRLSRIDLILPPDPAGAARLSAWLPAGLTLSPAGGRSEVLSQMTEAFNTNLQALAWLALLVAMLLIYNTMNFLIVHRREVIGGLRALGATRAQILRGVLAEALALGALGTLIGLPLGLAFARQLLELITRVINDIYFTVSIRALALPPSSLLKGVVLGLLVSVLAALAPALAASRVPPRSALLRSQLEQQSRRWVARAALAGAVTLFAGLALLVIPSRSVGLGIFAQFVQIFGGALLTPLAVTSLMRGLEPVVRGIFGSLGRMAVRGVTANLSRTAVAAAALMVAVASSVQIGLMIGSFRATVDQWLSQALRADVYVALDGAGDSVTNTLPPEFAQRLRALPGVAYVSSVRHVHLDLPKEVVHLAVYDLAPPSYPGYRFKDGDPAQVWQAFEQEDAVLVTEPYAYKHHIHAGSTVSLPADQGARAFKVAGVYYDYSSDRGVVMISRRIYERYWRDHQLSGLGVYLNPGADLEPMRDAIRNAAAPAFAVDVRTNRGIRERSLAIFDRTFIVTQVLQILATTVAFLGVFSALMALQLERAREHGLLRAIGLTPAQLVRLVVLECGLLGLAAGLFALPVGTMLARSLAQDINQRSFGWALDLQLSAAPLLQGLGAALVAALLAGLYPALRAARQWPATALRME